MRFLIPIAFLLGNEVKLSGKESLLKRPMTPYLDIAKKYGFKFDMTATDITLCGNLESGIYELDGNISSQFISGLLFALPLTSGDSEIKIKHPIESLSYIRLTLEAIGYFGIKAEFDEESGTIHIPGNQHYTPADVKNEGDFSGAAFTDALNHLGGEVEVLGIREHSKQGDSVYKEYFKLISEGTPRLDISDCPDLAPILFALAAAKHGASFIGTKRLKIKESDRAEAMRCELAKLGVKLTVYENEVEIKGSISAPKEPIFGHNDHRIVMAMAVLLSLVGGEIIGAEAISKSYPEFFRDLRALGITVNEYEA
jgi:3-phosphoshikimate 1-carboxyvinyltransferase